MSKGVKRKLFDEEGNDIVNNREISTNNESRLNSFNENKAKKKQKTLDSDFDYVILLKTGHLKEKRDKLYNSFKALNDKIRQDENSLFTAQMSTYIKDIDVLLEKTIYLKDSAFDIIENLGEISIYYTNDLTEIYDLRDDINTLFYNNTQYILENMVKMIKQYGATPNLPYILERLIDSHEIILLNSFVEQCREAKIDNFKELFNMQGQNNYTSFEVVLINFLDAKPEQIDLEILNLLLSNGVLSKNFDLKALLRDNDANSIDPYAIIQLYKFGLNIDKGLSNYIDNNLIEVLSNSDRNITDLFKADLDELKYEGSDFLKYNSKLLSNILKAIDVRYNLEKQQEWPSALDIKIDDDSLSLKMQILQKITYLEQADSNLPQELTNLLNVVKAANGIEVTYDHIDLNLFLRHMVRHESIETLENLFRLGHDQANNVEISGQTDFIEL